MESPTMLANAASHNASKIHSGFVNIHNMLYHNMIGNASEEGTR